MKKYFPRVLIVLLAVALIGSLLVVRQQKKVIERRNEMIELQSSFYFMRDVYLKEQDVGERSGYRLVLLDMHGLRSYEDKACQLLYELIQRVCWLPSDSDFFPTLSQRLDELTVIWDTRSGAYDSLLFVDTDALQALIDEVAALS